jgi:hypothetical protein
MRRRSTLSLCLPPLALAASLGGCASVGDSLLDQLTFGANPNRPIGASETMRRVESLDSTLPPITPEPGNVWPTGFEAIPTLGEQQANANTPLGGAAPLNGLPPGIRQPRPAPAATPVPSTGPASQGILVPNGNGTSTLIKPDGSVSTVPTPGK